MGPGPTSPLHQLLGRVGIVARFVDFFDEPEASDLDPDSDGEQIRATEEWSGTFADVSPLRGRSARRQGALWAPMGGSAASEAFTLPHRAQCYRCRREMKDSNARTTGLCDRCMIGSKKSCSICNAVLPLKQLRMGSGLCKPCFKSCEKNCRMCDHSLTEGQMRWATGLCDGCYEQCDKSCRFCQKQIERGQLHWGSGLCDGCYDNVDKSCKICSERLQVGCLRYGTGLCNSCYDKCEKECHHCKSKITLGSLHYRSRLCDPCYGQVEKMCKGCDQKIDVKELHWRTWLCDKCYDKTPKTCTFCQTRIEPTSLHWSTGKCDKCYDTHERRERCKMCQDVISAQERQWDTGLCDRCYNNCEKRCKNIKCGAAIAFGQLHWGSGLCDNCYNDSERKCKQCAGKIEIGQLHWRTGLCNTCFDDCGKDCKRCSNRLRLEEQKWLTQLCDQCYAVCSKDCRVCEKHLDYKQMHWGTGLCDMCYDNCEKNCRNCEIRMQQDQLHFGTGLCNKCYDIGQAGVKAVSSSQFVFYVAPACLQPSLYLQIKAAGFFPDAPTVFAAMLTMTSVLAMVAPVLLGLWAEYRGEREVYVGVSLLAAAAAAMFIMNPPAIVFIMSWAVLNLPPAIRGVRATYLARHVAPEDLSRKSQLSSSMGLLGGFLGPGLSALAAEMFGDVGQPHGWLDGFVACAIFSTAICALCAAYCAVLIPKPRPKKKGGGPSMIYMERCERCLGKLEEREKEYATALCNTCYNNYNGQNYDFNRYCRHVLVSFCLVASLLEFSMNAGVIATFQPIAVNHFGWGNDAIALVNFVGAGLSVIVSFTLSKMRCDERIQTAFGAGLYLFGVIIFTCPPVSQWQLVLGLLLGIKAQILFMAPFTSVFSRLIGRARVTNRRTTMLCLAPAIGGALGTSSAPVFIAAAGGPLFLLSAVPAALSAVLIALGWRFTMGPDGGGRRGSISAANNA